MEQLHRACRRSFELVRREATEAENGVTANTSKIRQAKHAINRAHGFVIAMVAAPICDNRIGGKTGQDHGAVIASVPGHCPLWDRNPDNGGMGVREQHRHALA